MKFDRSFGNTNGFMGQYIDMKGFKKPALRLQHFFNIEEKSDGAKHSNPHLYISIRQMCTSFQPLENCQETLLGS